MKRSVVLRSAVAPEGHHADERRSYRSRLSFVWALCLSMTLLACGDAERRRIGDMCSQSSECEDGPCGGGRCLDPQSDEDLDGLTNDFEASIGSNPVAADSDADGIPDRLELGPALELLDTDDDGSLDILESAVRDADNDCITDQYDARNDVPDADVAPMVIAVCSHSGVCVESSESGCGRCVRTANRPCVTTAPSRDASTSRTDVMVATKTATGAPTKVGVPTA